MKQLKQFTSMLLVGTLIFALSSCGATTGTPTTDTAAPATDAGSDTAAAEATTSGGGDSSLRGQNVRVLIGSTSTSGDSYLMADLVSRYLAEDMGFSGKVDAIGNASALDELVRADGDGKTVLMFHDMTFNSVLFGSVSEDYKLENMTVGPRIGQNPGGCFGVAEEAPYDDLAEITQYLLDNPSETVSFNIEAGASSHLCFNAYYLDVMDKHGEEVASRIKVIVGGTTADKLQRLWDRNADVIYGDTSAFYQYTEEGVDAQLKMVMFAAGGAVDGSDITSMSDEGVEFNGAPFDFTKDFAMYFPKEIDPVVLAEYDAAMQRVTENPDFKADMAALFYTSLSAEEVALEASQEFIYAKRETCVELVETAPSLDDLA